MMSKKDRDNLVQGIVERWSSDEPRYTRLEMLVAEFLKNELPSIELLPSVTHRVKSLMSMVKTALLKSKRYDDFKDKLGFRIVCHLKSELPIVTTFLEKSFVIHHYESKQDKLKFDALGYASDHYEVSIKPELAQFANEKDVHDLVFEIQVRTICQHAWADVEHSLLYKQEAELPDDIKRKIFRLTSLLEICDDEFDEVNKYLLNLSESKAFNVLRLVEGKFYRYAKRSYDRELSIVTISSLIGGMRLDEDFSSLTKSLEEFINRNESRIGFIFNERRAQLDRDIYLSQPETLFLWFLIEKYPHNVVPAWRSQFDIEDLQDLAIVWGVSLSIPE